MTNNIQRHKLESITSRFQAAGTFEDVRKRETGHINKTYVITMLENGRPRRYILQSINTTVFTHPEELMQNIVGVTTFLKKKIEAYGGDVRRETLTVIPTEDGSSFYVDEEGKYWRMYDYIEGATSYETVVRPILFKNTARAFGKFQKLLSDYPAHTLFETIPKFHDTADRMRQLRESHKTGSRRSRQKMLLPKSPFIWTGRFSARKLSDESLRVNAAARYAQRYQTQ